MKNIFYYIVNLKIINISRVTHIMNSNDLTNKILTVLEESNEPLPPYENLMIIKFRGDSTEIQ